MSPGLQVGMSGSLPAIKTSECLSPSKGQQQGMTPREGVQVHSYHKLFWRLNCTLEFNIFHHDDRNIYEVAAYNSEKDYEYEPIFLHAAEVMKLCAPPDLVTKEVEVVTTKLSKDRFSQKPSPDKIIDMAKNNIFKKYIESHLTPKPEGIIAFVSLPGEEIDLEAIVYSPPKDEDEEKHVAEIDPTSNENISGNTEQSTIPDDTTKVEDKPKKSRRRTVVTRARSSIEDYNKTLSILQQDSQNLKQANAVAENMLSLSELSVNAFKNALQQASGNTKENTEFYNKGKPLGRFRWAVHRVVLQNAVEAVKKRIEVLGKKKTMRLHGTFPSPDATDLQSPQAAILSLSTRLNSSPQMKKLSESLSRENSPANSRKSSVVGVGQSASLPAL